MFSIPILWPNDCRYQNEPNNSYHQKYHEIMNKTHLNLLRARTVVYICIISWHHPPEISWSINPTDSDVMSEKKNYGL